MTREVRLTFVIVCVAGAISICAIFVSAVTPPTVGDVRAGPADIYPQVPGSINNSIDEADMFMTICNPNWSTSSERPPSNYTTALKIAQLKSYGNKDQKTADYEEDHLISLELGGNPTDSNNLWSEPYTASIPDGGAKTKDKVENYLHAQVCAGTISLTDAQQEISTDWYSVYVKNLKGKYGSIQDDSDPDDE